MPLPTILIWFGTGLTIIGLIGLGICVFKALAVRRDNHKGDGRETLQKLVALNMASVGIATIGLATLIVGLIL